ncbi:MAG TPA: carbohydrate ABC transporter permease [Iamia sp.]|nr:carbohydrate ABC transporter permease [Iamia sp.]
MGAERTAPGWMTSRWFAAVVMIVCVPLSLALYGAFIRVAAEPTDLVAWLVLAATVGITVGFFSFQPRENRWYLALTALAVIVLAPIYFLIVRAISDPSKSFTSSVLTPVGVRFDGFSKAWSRGDLDAAMLRTLIVTLLITTLQVATSVLAAYAFAFLSFPLKKVVFAFFMATLLLPLEVTLLPNLQTMRDLDWFNTYQGLVVPFAASAFGTFLIRQGFLGIPSEIRDAARLEGWGHFAFLWKFAVPLTRPVIASFTVISFLGAFNQYLWPRAVITDTEKWSTVQLALRGLTTSVEESHISVAGAIITAVPIVILLALFQRQIVSGLTAGAVKG